MNYTEFLTARYDEDASSADEIHNGMDCASCGPIPFSCDCGVPARMLREVEAKRMILAEYESFRVEVNWPGARAGAGVITGYEELRFAVGALAAVYSDHPDYEKIEP